MHISEVKTAIKIGKFVLRDKGPNLIQVQYLPGLDNLLNDDSGRVYIFVEDGIIKKIGGSQQAGGIKATLSFYENAQQGSPGRPRFILHHLIANSLREGHRVEIYMITSPKITATVKGLFSIRQMKIASFKEMENLCKKEYFDQENKYPDWNFQENRKDYPRELEEKYQRYHGKRIARRSR